MITALRKFHGTTRKMVQAEWLNLRSTIHLRLYATSTLPVMNFHWRQQQPSTDSYNSENGAYRSNGNHSLRRERRAIGGVSLSGHSQIGGNVGVQSLPGGAQFPCPRAITY